MVTAFVLINCDLGYEENVINSLKQLDEVDDVQGTFGAYDIIVKISTPDRDRLRDAITWKIRKLQNIRSTLTLYDTEQGVER